MKHGRLLTLLAVLLLAVSLFAAIPAMAAEEADIRLQYDDRKDLSSLVDTEGEVVISDEVVTSYKVGTTEADPHVLVYENGTLYAVGTGTATLTVGETAYTVEVSPAPLSIFMITGHSIGAGQEGSGAQSVLLEDGAAYSTFRTTLTSDGMGLGYGADQRPDNIDAFGEGGGGTKGTGSAIAYRWNQLTGDKVWIINAAVGGSCINEWQPGYVSPRGEGYSRLYDKAVANFQAAQTILKREIAAGHYTMGEMAIFNHTSANFQAHLGNYTDFTQESLEKDFDTLWTGFKNDLMTDMDGDGTSETVSAMGFVPLWTTSGVKEYGTDKPAVFFMAASEAYPDLFMASQYDKWSTAEGLKKFPEITYTTQDGIALQKPVTPTDASGKGFYCGYGEKVAVDNAEKLCYYVRGEADAWLTANAAEHWGNAVVTAPMTVAELQKIYQEFKAEDEQIFVAAIG